MLAVMVATQMCISLLDIMIIIALMITMAVMGQNCCNDHNGCNTCYHHNYSNLYNGSDDHNECDGFIIYEFCYLLYISHEHCSEYGHCGWNGPLCVYVTPLKAKKP